MCENNPDSHSNEEKLEDCVTLTSLKISDNIEKNKPHMREMPKKSYVKHWVDNSNAIDQQMILTNGYGSDLIHDDLHIIKRDNRQSESSDSGYQKKTGDDEVSSNSFNGTAEVLSDRCCDLEVASLREEGEENETGVKRSGSLDGDASPSLSPSSSTCVTVNTTNSAALSLKINQLSETGNDSEHVNASQRSDLELCDEEVYILRNADGQEICMHSIPAELWPEDWQDESSSAKNVGVDDIDFDDPNLTYFYREIPKHYAGIVFGKRGKNLRDLRDRLGSKIQLTEHPDNPNCQILHLFTPKENLHEVKRWLYRKLNIAARNDQSDNTTNISNPHQLVQFIPEGEFVPVIPLGMPSKTELFVQIYQPDQYEKFMEFQQRLNAHYSTDDCPRLPIPVSVGCVCVAPYTDGRYYRAKITHRAISVENEELALVMYLDYGGFMWHPITSLHKIRSEFMNFNFQATLIKWAHALPISPVAQDEIYARYMANRILYVYGVTTLPCCVTHAVLYVPSKPLDAENITKPEPSALFDILGQAVLEGHYQAIPYTLPERVEVEGIGGYIAPETGAFMYTELNTIVDVETMREHRQLAPSDGKSNQENDTEPENTAPNTGNSWSGRKGNPHHRHSETIPPKSRASAYKPRVSNPHSYRSKDRQQHSKPTNHNKHM